MRAVIDFESRSTVDIGDTGAWPYAEHATTSVMWLCYAIGGGPVQSWRPGMADPADLLAHVAAGLPVVAHNAQFEWCIWNLNLRGVHGYAWPELRTEQLDDTMARALVMALPPSLEGVGAALGLQQQKDTVGHRLMLKMCKPVPERFTARSRRIRDAEKALTKAEAGVVKAQTAARPSAVKTTAAEAALMDAQFEIAAARSAPQVVEWYESPEDVERLRQYCATDIEVERALDRLLPPLSPTERRIWEFDQRVNQRGVAVDLESAKLAHAVVQDRMADANARLAEITGGAVEKVTNHAALGKWLRAQGVDAPNTQAETIELLLEGEHPPHVREVLEIRRDAGKASVAKLPALIAQTASDGNAHGLLMYAGAGRTRRWAGRGAQPQNLPRPEFKQKAIDQIFGLLRYPRAAEAIELLYGHPVSVLSSCLRGMFVAGAGKQLTASDLSNIEGRVAAWVAGEQWKLDAFRAFDNGTGPDLYKLAYARTFGGNPADVGDDSDERQIGKVMELFLQYEGGAGAFNTGAATYGFDILSAGQKPRPGRKSIPAEIVPQAIAGWRGAHPNIKRIWRELNDLAIAAVNNSGETFRTSNGRVSFVRRKWYLFMRLPNGREIPYFKPHVVPGDFGLELRYWGIHSKTKQWCSLGTYGGKLFENCLTGDTLVRTLSGWKRLDTVSRADLVFDGVEFVKHGGLASSGVRPVIELDGVRMTPDHRVLTSEGWRCASSCEGFDRASVGHVDRHPVRGFGRQKVSLARALRLRHRKANARDRAAERQSEVVRLQSSRWHLRGEQAARDVFASGVLCLAEHGRPVHPADAQGMEELRRPRHHCLRRMARQLRRVLARHGADLCRRADFGPGEQLPRLQPWKLPVDGSQNAMPQHPSQRALRNTVGPDDSRRGIRAERRQKDDASLSAGPRAFRFGPCVDAGRSEPVFDIVNCGPRQRFVVMGRHGPFIVHNCVQALARDAFAEGLLRAEAAGMHVVMHVHDAAVTEHAPGLFTDKDLARLLCALGPEWDGLPVSAKGYTGQRFQK